MKRLIKISTLVVVMLLCVVAKAATSPSDYAAYDLRCDNLREPLGLDNVAPRFSWKLRSALRGDVQTAYQVQVASSKELLCADKADIWDSNRCTSDQSVMVEYAGKPLQQRSVYYWRVRSWNKDETVSEWSEVACFGVGVLDGLRGEYVGLNESDGDVHSPLIRKKINITPGQAVMLHVNSLGYHEVYANGHKVGDNVLAPAVSQLTKRSLIVAYDLSPYIAETDQTVDIVLWIGQGWYKTTTFNAAYEGPLVKAEVCQKIDGRWQTIDQTDSFWSVSEGGYRDTGTWYALQFGGERVDGAIVPSSLEASVLDQRRWHTAMTKAVQGMTATPQMCEGNRIIARIQPLSVRNTGQGEWLLDMGRVLTGWFELRMNGLSRGHEVKMEYTDHIDKGQNFQSQGESDVYIAAGNESERFCNKFNHHAYRYVRISNLPTFPDATALQISGDYQQITTFECSDEELNEVHDMIQRTMRCLTFSGYMVDCPHLERTGYGGDGNSSTMTLQTMYDVSPTYYNWMQAWGDVIEDDGSLPYVAPAGGGGGGPYWCGFFIKAPWRTMVNYGDSRLMQRHYAGMKRWLEYVDKNSTDGLLGRWQDTHNRMWFLGDWLAPMGVDVGAEESVLLVANCLVSDCLRSMTHIAKHLGNDADSRLYERKRLKLNKAIHKRFFNEDTNTYATGSPLDMAYPLLTDVVPTDMVEKVNNRLVETSYSQYKAHIAVGLVGVAVFTEWAIKHHAADLVRTILKQHDYPSYLYMIDNGATTTWEYWNGERSRVHNCYNGIGTWFYQALGGLRPDETSPGYKHVVIDPQTPRGVDWTRVARDTPYGMMSVAWQRNNDTLTVEITLPVGTTATYKLPKGTAEALVDDVPTAITTNAITLVSGTTKIAYKI